MSEETKTAEQAECLLCAAGIPRVSYTLHRDGEDVEMFAHQSEPKGTGEFRLANCPVRDSVESMSGAYTSCAACDGNGCDRCMPHLHEIID